MSTVYISKTTSVVVVEDNQNRINWFESKLSGMNRVVCKTPAKALNVLGVHRFDLVFLDHDCEPDAEGQIISDPELSFIRVAELLAKMNYDGKVIIHSMNPIGALRMKHILERTADVSIIPISTLKIEQI